MKQLRSLLIIISFAIFAVGALIFNFIIFPLAKLFLAEKEFQYFASDFIHSSWSWYVKYLISIKLFSLQIKNSEKLKNIKEKIIVSTHPSFVDIVILIALIPRCSCYVKSSLAHHFLLKNIIPSIFITDDVELEELELKTQDLINKGFNIIIFPSGIRHRKNEQPKIKKGAALMAIRSNKDILPLKLYSDGDFMFINQPFYSAGDRIINFSLEVCDTINVNDYYNDSEIVMKKKITDEIVKVFYK